MTRLSNCHEDAKELSKEFVTPFVFFLAPLRDMECSRPKRLGNYLITLVETIPKMKYLITLLKSIIGIR
ncbi:MAG TPA: hypothetical protein VE933_10350 [Chitinophagaceae bacterium]|nr:hypothetical protein [Chitinophagaceae bacterium]